MQPIRVDQVYEYRRSAHLLSSAVWFGALAFSCMLFGSHIQSTQGAVPFADLLLLSLFTICIGSVGLLSGRFCFKAQWLSLHRDGVAASYLNRGERILWEEIQGFTLTRRGIQLDLRSNRRVGDLFVRPAIEVRGLPMSAADLHHKILVLQSRSLSEDMSQDPFDRFDGLSGR
jgi:hypothetical protein